MHEHTRLIWSRLHLRALICLLPAKLGLRLKLLLIVGQVTQMFNLWLRLEVIGAVLVLLHGFEVFLQRVSVVGKARAELWVPGSRRVLAHVIRRLDDKGVSRRGDSVATRCRKTAGEQSDLAVADEVLDDLGPLGLHVPALWLGHAHLTNRLKLLKRH